MGKIPNPIMEGYLSALKSISTSQAPKTAKRVSNAAKKVAKTKKPRPFYPTPSGKKPAWIDPRKSKPKARPVKPRTRPLSVKEALNTDFEVYKPATRAVVARQSRVEKTAANIRKAYPTLSEAEVMKRASMTKSQRSAYLSEKHAVASADSAAAKAATRAERQAANRSAHAEKNRAKMNRFERYKMDNPNPTPRKRGGKKGAK